MPKSPVTFPKRPVTFVRNTQIKSLAQGSTRYNLSKIALLDGRLKLPREDEQAAIAEILSDMDAELARLEARHHKTKLLKQGMMQELLTGKTRLV